MLGWGVTAGLAPLNDTNSQSRPPRRKDDLVADQSATCLGDDTTTGCSFAATYNLTLTATQTTATSPADSIAAVNG